MVYDSSGDSIVSRLPDGRPYFEPDDAWFIANARTDLPAALADRATLKAEVERRDNTISVLKAVIKDDCEDEDAVLALVRGALPAAQMTDTPDYTIDTVDATGRLVAAFAAEREHADGLAEALRLAGIHFQHFCPDRYNGGNTFAAYLAVAAALSTHAARRKEPTP
jgi:hypothetical protein